MIKSVKLKYVNGDRMKEKHIFLSRKSEVIMISVMISLIILFLGSLFVRNRIRNIQNEKKSSLQAIADLKVEQLIEWRKERRGDALIFSERHHFIRRIEEYLLKQDDALRKADLIEDLDTVVRVFGYESILLTSPEGEPFLFSGSGSEHLGSLTAEMITTAVKSLQITFTDFYPCDEEDKVHYDIISPLLNEKKNIIAVMILTINPTHYLYPVIQSWPTPSRTSETLIVRKDGQDVLFLNELRHQKNTALKLRIPLTATKVPAVQAVLGYQGIWEGRDYRNEKVLADIRPIPETSWFLISKIDKKEFYRQIYNESLLFVLILLSCVITAGSVLALIYSFNQRNIYRILYRSQEEFKTTLNCIGDAVITTDTFGKVRFLNPVAEQLTGWKENDALGSSLTNVFKIINENTRKDVSSPVNKIIRKGAITGLANHTLLLSKDGREIPIADSGAPIRDKKGDIVGVVLVFRDQTKERDARKALLRSEKSLTKAQKVSHVGSWEWKITENRLEWSDEMYRIFGIEREEFTGNLSDVLSSSIHPEDRDKVEQSNLSVIKDKTPIPLEYRIIRPDGTTRTVWAEAGEMILDETGNPSILTGIVQDITERKEAEVRIRKDLVIKETLLKEIHHRVKNNLNIIISLLNLQSGKMIQKEAKDALQIAIRRIFSMALIHEKLYQSKDFSEIDFTDYVSNLCRQILTFYPDKSEDIDIKFKLDTIKLSIDTAIPCGLILNEILTNALKHAFPDHKKGTIEVRLHRMKDQSYRLIVRDDGVGMPKITDMESIPTLGLQLIHLLAQQIEGTVKVDNTKGTEISIHFKGYENG